MKSGNHKTLRKRMPTVYKHVHSGSWYIGGTTGKNHIWLVHTASGRKITAPNSASDFRAERNLLRQMDRIAKGYH